MAFIIFIITSLVLLAISIGTGAGKGDVDSDSPMMYLVWLCIGIALLCAIYIMFTVSVQAGLSMIGALAGLLTVSKRSSEKAKERNITPKSSAAKVDHISNALQSAIKSIKAGDEERGKRLLGQVIQADPQNEMAWLWWTQVVDSDEERLIGLRKVLDINPNNELAKRGLAALQRKNSQLE